MDELYFEMVVKERLARVEALLAGRTLVRFAPGRRSLRTRLGAALSRLGERLRGSTGEPADGQTGPVPARPARAEGAPPVAGGDPAARPPGGPRRGGGLRRVAAAVMSRGIGSLSRVVRAEPEPP